MARLLRYIAPFLVLLVAAAPAWAQTTERASDHPLFTGPVHEAPAARFDQEHLRLALRFDDTRRVFGDATLRLAPLDPEQFDSTAAPLLLRTAGMAIDSVLIGASVPAMTHTAFRSSGDSLQIPLDSLFTAPDSLFLPFEGFEVRVFYNTQPRRGLFFVAPSRQNSAQKRQIWTLNAPGATRHWIPVLDAPTDMMTSEVLITADSSRGVFSNGRRVEEIDNEDGTVTTYFRQDNPHTPRHLMLAVGDYEAHQNTARVASPAQSISLSYRVYPEHIGDVARTFGRTPEMMTFFAENLNVPFPRRSYDQVILRQVHQEGQALAGAAAFSDDIMLDERAALSENVDPLLARMLAHQWFGGGVTAGSWADAWLDEGFATYLSALFTEHHQDAGAFALTMMDHAERYQAEARHYRRPLVWNRWIDPSDVLDAHSAQKGAWVLHMIRRKIGDALFWNVLENYLTTFAFQSVDTADFKRVLERVTGENFDTFFAQWVEAAGHPLLAARYTYDTEAGQLAVIVTQEQEGAQVPDVFRTTLTLEVHTLSEVLRFEVDLEADSQVFTFPLPGRPRFLLIDPDHDVLAETRVNQPARAWMRQLRQGPDPVSRIHAARALTAFADDPSLLVGLRSALRDESSAAARQAIAGTLGHLPATTATKRLLMGMMQDEDARVRAAVLDALASYENEPDVHELAFQTAQNDRSYHVQAAAVKTLARTAAPTALDVVRSALITPSHRDIIRRAAFEALPLLDLPAREGVALGLKHSTADQPTGVRLAAIDYLHIYAPESRAALNRLIESLDDEDARVRAAAIESLSLVATEQALKALRAHQPAEPQPRLQEAVRRALRLMNFDAQIR